VKKNVHDTDTWELFPEKAIDIGVGSEGSVWIISAT